MYGSGTDNLDQEMVLAFPTDVHGPYADPVAWELALKVIEGMNPNVLIWGSDAMDFGSISKYMDGQKIPVSAELEDEFVRRKELKSAAPNASLWWLQDNHTTERYEKYISTRAPELLGLESMKFGALINMPDDRIISEYNAGDTLRVIHGSVVKKQPGISVLTEIMEPGNRRGRLIRSLMMGHVHRYSYVSLDNGIEGMECGTLQVLNPKYMRQARRATNWSHGIGLARFGRNWSSIIPARFVVKSDNLVCRVEGVEYAVKITKSYSGV